MCTLISHLFWFCHRISSIFVGSAVTKEPPSSLFSYWGRERNGRIMVAAEVSLINDILWRTRTGVKGWICRDRQVSSGSPVTLSSSSSSPSSPSSPFSLYVYHVFFAESELRVLFLHTGYAFCLRVECCCSALEGIISFPRLSNPNVPHFHLFLNIKSRRFCLLII